MTRRRGQWFLPEEYGHTKLGKQVADIVHAGGRAELGRGIWPNSIACWSPRNGNTCATPCRKRTTWHR
jgi:hypothetical protein